MKIWNRSEGEGVEEENVDEIVTMTLLLNVSLYAGCGFYSDYMGSRQIS